MKVIAFCSFLFISILAPISASVGDRSPVYKRCLATCSDACVDGAFDTNQTYYMNALGWTCTEECKYDCTWKTVDVFTERGYNIPQFYGKWPFKRILGIQEPASCLFSILNGLANVLAFRRFFKYIPSRAPMFFVTFFQLIVACNAWFWSSVFHTLDFMWTERLDYFSATSLVLYALYFTLHRWTMEVEQVRSRKKLQLLCRNFLLAVYVAHVSYLTFRKFDYGFNMRMNVSFGVANTISVISLWLLRRNEHQWKCVLIVILTNVFIGFELLDFPPLSWIIDAHAIWHLLTIPLPFLFYSYAADVCLYLLKEKEA